MPRGDRAPHRSRQDAGLADGREVRARVPHVLGEALQGYRGVTGAPEERPVTSADREAFLLQIYGDGQKTEAAAADIPWSHGHNPFPDLAPAELRQRERQTPAAAPRTRVQAVELLHPVDLQDMVIPSRRWIVDGMV